MLTAIHQDCYYPIPYIHEIYELQNLIRLIAFQVKEQMHIGRNIGFLMFQLPDVFLQGDEVFSC